MAIEEALDRADSIVRANEEGFVAAVVAVRVLVAAVEAAAPVFGTGDRVSADV